MVFKSFEQIQFFEKALFECFGKDIEVNSFEFVAGGCINNAVKVSTPKGDFFIKTNVQELEGMFEAEAKGFGLLRKSQCITIPEVVGAGKQADQAYLILEYVESGVPQKKFWEDFGEKLAQLHQISSPYFGLEFNNWIGSLPQSNEPIENGILFLIEKRLKPQAGLAWYEGILPDSLFQKFNFLYEKFPNFLPNEKPALLHGDLWSGNFMVNIQGTVTLIDPAVYYGFREMELAFTKLFGGFEQKFYESYQSVFPLEKGFEERVELYNLYPLLVHLNLFGSGYLSGIERTLKKFVG